MHTLNFFVVSLISSLEHQGVGSLTFTMIPASSYFFLLRSFGDWYSMHWHLHRCDVCVDLEVYWGTKITYPLEVVIVLCEKIVLCEFPWRW